MQKLKVAVEHATKVQMGGTDIALPIHNLGAKRGNNLHIILKCAILHPL